MSICKNCKHEIDGYAEIEKEFGETALRLHAAYTSAIMGCSYAEVRAENKGKRPDKFWVITAFNIERDLNIRIENVIEEWCKNRNQK